MNFDEAILAHRAWKTKLSTYLGQPDGSLKPDTIEPDDKCPLGEWIYGEGAKHSANPAYAALKAEHANFHRAAAEVVRKANLGQSTTEDVALGSISDFGTSSAAVVL